MRGPGNQVESRESHLSHGAPGGILLNMASVRQSHRGDFILFLLAVHFCKYFYWETGNFISGTWLKSSKNKTVVSKMK